MLRLRNGLPREVMAGRGDCVVQVGMWRRRNLLRLARCVGRNGRVLLIEADPRVVDDLRAFIEEQGLSQVEVVNCGAYSEAGETQLKVGVSPGHNRLGPSGNVMLNEVGREVFEAEVTIPVERVDRICKERGVDRVDYCEITVNGLEEHVLRGMSGLLPRCRRVFVAGYARLPDGRPANLAGERRLRSHGFHTIISRKTTPSKRDFDPAAAAEWGDQEGHVFAWRV